MSYHVYIAKPGFKEEPIEYDDWIAVAKEIASERDNFVIGEKKRRNKPAHYFGHLKSCKRQWLTISPYGLVYAQDPTRELVEVMFEVAKELGAQVYSERSKPYRDVSDWEKRTKNFRQKQTEGKLTATKAKKRKMLFWLVVVVIGVLIGSVVRKAG